MTTQGRTSHEIETPIGKQTIVIHDWLIGGEKRAMMGISGGERVVKLSEALIVSIDGEKEKTMEKLDNMHGKDFDFVLAELGKIAMESSADEKKTEKTG